MTKITSQVPTYEDLMIPTVKALQKLGGSGSTDEIYEQVIELLNFPDEIIDVLHDAANGSSQTEIAYRLAWARTYLKKYGILESSSRGVWAISPNAEHPDHIDPKAISKKVREADKSKGKERPSDRQSPIITDVEEITDNVTDWREQLQQVLLSIKPDAFERLCQRLLRESGFTHVEVTGKSGDGGIDGIGIVRMNGFLSFHVLFQCKRYQGSVTPSQIRDFRGSMQGRTDKGLVITTGTFTREAIKEATRDGAPPIDLIDGEKLIEKLKELSLGVKIQMVESVEIDADWFTRI